MVARLVARLALVLGIVLVGLLVPGSGPLTSTVGNPAAAVGLDDGSSSPPPDALLAAWRPDAPDRAVRDAAIAASLGATQVSAGRFHTCALTSGGAVKCWGSNSDGQLGDGTQIYRYTPVAVSGLDSGITTISAGDGHTCALTSVGAVKCWGAGAEGQLGDGSGLNRSTPTAVSNLNSGVTAISAGRHRSCAVTSAGAVKCWGDNYYGDLGDGTQIDRYTPVAVSGLDSGITAVSVGYFHTCALTSAGAAKCWGSNHYGQLGDSTLIDRYTPVAVSGLESGITTISAGDGHTCALTSGGAVKCLGSNSYGQLGDSTQIDRYTPVAVSGLDSGVTAISAGDLHVCALISGGAVKCWGWNDYGELGDGTTTSRYTPVAVSSLDFGVVAISAGSIHTCAATSAGGVKCWGHNVLGQLGDGTTTSRLTPVEVVGFEGIVGYAISGRVTDSAGAGLARVGVKAESVPPGTTLTAVTNSDGNYSIVGLAAGTYTLTPSYSDAQHQRRTFFPAKYNNVDIPASSGPVTDKSFRLVEPFLDLPFDYSYSTFYRAAAGNTSSDPGRVNSWYDHSATANRVQTWRWCYTITNLGDSCAPGAFSKGISWYDGHNGTDFSNRSYQDENGQSRNTRILAAAAGTVVSVNTGCEGKGEDCGGGFGNYVWLDHGNGYRTIYGHLDLVDSTIIVKAGKDAADKTVSAHQYLGVMGNTGRSDATHLHFGVYYNKDSQSSWSPRTPLPTSIDAFGDTVDPYGWSSAIGSADPSTNINVRLWIHPLEEQNPLGSEGGSFTTPSGSTTAIVLPDAVSSPVNISIGEVSVAAPSAQLRSTGRSFWLQVLEWLGLGGSSATTASVASAASNSFAQPVTLTTSYDPQSVLHLDTTQLQLYRWDEATQSWIALPTTIDVVQHTATAQTTETGSFDLQAPLLCPADSTEPDDSYASASPQSADGAAIHRLFDVTQDEDWLQIDAISGGRYDFQTGNLASGVDTVLTLYAPDAATVLASDDNGAGGEASEIQWQAPTSDTYYLRVSRASGGSYGCSATYDVTATIAPFPRVYLPFVSKP